MGLFSERITLRVEFEPVCLAEGDAVCFWAVSRLMPPLVYCACLGSMCGVSKRLEEKHRVYEFRECVRGKNGVNTLLRKITKDKSVCL